MANAMTALQQSLEAVRAAIKLTLSVFLCEPLHQSFCFYLVLANVPSEVSCSGRSFEYCISGLIIETGQ